MICEVCKKNRIQKVIEESKKAMERFTKKLKEEKYDSHRKLYSNLS